MQLCFASNNTHKLKEIKAMLPHGFELLGLNDIGCKEELPETSATIEANSIQKARYVFEHYGIACFADDTGLEVMALDGAPGVDSAHYAGEARNADANMALLLENLSSKSDRSAQFKTVITLVLPNETRTFEGIVKGKIIHEKRGDKGFGYDPLFVPDGYDQTFAEMPSDLKNRISHRALAFQKFMSFLLQSQP